ncbi:activating transcription factor 7-interacting protein 2 isoform X1 [Acanthopagrus latus]|uniref:activating transcription factor 7-interacting protein 2 isoform X1 n=2 Tax=Acanthopagrus latus TaxID=8177 RepID=UPI00187BE244|nr:activating transcription factor 7-interacting protein 2 isoform X1 [Acanthopagrus latus]XP_036944969.1 activating transcription factor 7-interacting protein 2 isoform X1 [Acanthopagrus latus]
MAGAQNRTRGRTSSKKYRPRVNIGLAFGRWRAMKTAKGLKSDEEVAQRLLDAMKRLPSSSDSFGASDKKIKFSQSEVQTLIEQEVRSVLKNNETRLQGLYETIQHLECQVDYESSIKKLEARVNTVSERAEAALAYMAKTKKKSPLPSLVNVEILRSESEDEGKETRVSQKKMSMKCMDSRSGELSNLMETKQLEVDKMQAEKKALTAAVEDLNEERSPPPYGSPDCKGLNLKKEPDNIEVSMQSEEPKVNAECSSAGHSNYPECADLDQDKPLYPPLPATTFPSVYSIEVASYTIPQRPEVRLALIRNPPSLSVLWNVSHKEPSAPPMDSYSLYITMEKVKGSGIFPKWIAVGEVKAIDLPMCVMISKYKPGRKVCVSVVGKDIFGRYGPYSEVVTADIPDTL